MAKTKRILLFYILGPLVIACIIFFYVLASCLKTYEKFYYIKEANLYIKIIKPPMNQYGYLFISNDSIFLLSDIDFIRVYKAETASINIIKNLYNSSNLYISDDSNCAVISPAKYEINKVNFNDTTIYSMEKVAGVQTYSLKPQYISILIDGYLESLYINEDQEESLKEIKPIESISFYDTKSFNSFVEWLIICFKGE